MPTYLFAYGTLQPGFALPAMTPLVGRMTPSGLATVSGKLFDLGSYPGLILDDAGEVHGQLMLLPETGDVWAALDSYEGYDADDPGRSLFRRVATIARTARGNIECTVYVFNGDPARGRLIRDGIWRGAGMNVVEAEKSDRPKHRRPVIGVTLDRVDDKPRYMLPFDYTAAIERAGGLPVVIPYRTDLSLIPQIVDLLDGILFTGGNDLDPSLYGQKWHPKAEQIDPDRQKFELALMAEVERRRIPALGVCLGSQLINVYRGGSLTQFLPEDERDSALEHRKLNDDTRRHAVHIEPGTILYKAIGKNEIMANTRHKQAMDRIGNGLKVSARAPDGVVEGIEDPSMPLFLGVQWHPENLSSDQPEHLAPFKLLVERATAKE